MALPRTRYTYPWTKRQKVSRLTNLIRGRVALGLDTEILIKSPDTLDILGLVPSHISWRDSYGGLCYVSYDDRNITIEVPAGNHHIPVIQRILGMFKKLNAVVVNDKRVSEKV